MLRHVKTQIPTEERLKLVEKNFLQWTAWCNFQGSETLERVFDVPANHDWFKRWTASEDFLCPADDSNKEVQAQLERFVLMHKNKETLQSKPTPKGAL